MTMQASIDFETGAAQKEAQFRLAYIQLQNWGTFSGRVKFEIPAEGMLLTGSSGSGKSTILDAHATIMTRPKWVSFNVAAREGDRNSREDRNLMTYLRGAWSAQTGDEGTAVVQYLRPDTTWSVLSETYRCDTGAIVSIGVILWVRGKSSSTNDVKRRYFVLERELDLAVFEAFAQSEFDVRALKRAVPDIYVQDEFSPYEERFRRLLGIEQSTAMKLLHKTQSVKNVGDLNVFLREYMLEEPSTFDLADKLVHGFNELNEAHQAVKTARDQVGVLQPAQEAYEKLAQAEKSLRYLQELGLAVEPYTVQLKESLLEEAVSTAQILQAGLGQELVQAEQREGAAQLELARLQEKRNDQGGRVLEQLQAGITQANQSRSRRLEQRNRAQRHWQTLDLAAPETAMEFAAVLQQALDTAGSAEAKRNALAEERDMLKRRQNQLGEELQTLRREITVMEEKGSNLPSKLLDARERMAAAIGVSEQDLPFAGELIEVKATEQAWRGSIERVLNGFAHSLLVDERYYQKVSQYVNQTNLGVRLVYLRMTAHVQPDARAASDSLYHKLVFANGAPQVPWVKAELVHRFDYACAETLDDFRRAVRAVTREGQVKHNASRHEKNDLVGVNDSRHWVLAFDISEKIALYKKHAQDTALALSDVDSAIRELEDARKTLDDKVLHASALSNFQWDDLDVASAIALVEELQARYDRERQARPNLEQINQEITAQEALFKQLRTEVARATAALSNAERELTLLRGELDNLPASVLGMRVPAELSEDLGERVEATGKTVNLGELSEIRRLIERQFERERGQLEGVRNAHLNFIEKQFAHFTREWPAEAGGLDATLASADDFFTKLRKLIEDGLPQYVERFRGLLREHSDQSLAHLATRLEDERKDIRLRMELVNESLATAPYNPGTHLVISTEDRQLEDVRQFRQELRGALSRSFESGEAVEDERFQKLSALVKRLSSAETVHRNWRNLVLDVRQHVDFVAREVDVDGNEVERHRGGAGKSGGQRQKLTSTCLAAALRYQLGGRDRAVPMFSTVFMDEAFDKADAEFTEAAMNIFKTFGFQMVIATPLKSVMTLEPFIGGACFVDITDRKHSRVTMIAYDREQGRLLLPSQVSGESDEALVA